MIDALRSAGADAVVWSIFAGAVAGVFVLAALIAIVRALRFRWLASQILEVRPAPRVAPPPTEIPLPLAIARAKEKRLDRRKRSNR